jgi:hypothetical protein
MRARLQKYLPIFVIALLVQVLAPIGICWAAALAAADPLSGAEICHNSGFATDQPNDQNGQHSEHANGCSICCLAGAASSSIDMPTQAVLPTPYRELARVVWQEQTPDLSVYRVGSNGQARAPPLFS